jgi:YVTN family beta-propeller protein
MRIEERLREAFSNRAGAAGFSEDAWEAIQAGMVRQQRRRTAAGFLAAGGAVLVLAVSTAWMWTALRAGPGPGSGSEAPLDPRVTATIDVGDYPAGIAAGEGAVWVAVPSAAPHEDCSGQMVRIDPSTNAVAARIPIAGWPSNVAIGFGSVWVEGLLCTPDGDAPALTRIDPRTNSVSDAVSLAAPGVGSTSADVAVGEGAVWVTLSADPTADAGEVVRIDPATNSVAARVPVQGTPRDVVVGDGGVWVLTLLPEREAHLCGAEGPCEAPPGSLSGMEVLHIDPVANQVVESYPNALSVGVGEGAVWIGVWLTEGDLGLVRMDPQTGRRIGEPLPGDFRGFAGEHGTIGTLVTGNDGLWYWGFPSPDSPRGQIQHLDAADLRVDAAVDHYSSWIDAALDPEGQTLWISNYEDTVIRIDLR